MPIAFVALAPGADVSAAELHAWAADHVPERAAAPRHVEIVNEIPLTAVGKPFKPELRRRAAERAATAALAGTPAQAHIRAVLVDGAVVIHVPRGLDDASVREVLSSYTWNWRVG